MNPNSNETSIQLPPPMPEQAPAPGVLPENGPAMARPEALPGAELNRGAPVAQTAAMPTMPLPAVGSSPQSPALPAASNAVLPDGADDSDLIEKEWVEKAKQIIEKTRHDPHEQTKEVTLLKADYMKKRYNKTIKLSE